MPRVRNNRIKAYFLCSPPTSEKQFVSCSTVCMFAEPQVTQVRPSMVLRSSNGNGVKVRLWTHYRIESAASSSARRREAPQPAGATKVPGDLAQASPTFGERSEVQKTGGISITCWDVRKRARRRDNSPNPCGIWVRR